MSGVYNAFISPRSEEEMNETNSLLAVGEGDLVLDQDNCLVEKNTQANLLANFSEDEEREKDEEQREA